MFLALIVSLAIFTSPGWLSRYSRDKARASVIITDTLLCRLVVLAPVTIYLQILIGATMRHTGAGLAIPDFPLAFDRLIPPTWDAAIAIHFAHRVGAVVVTLLVLVTAGHVVAHHRKQRELVRPAVLLIAVVLAQVTLGAWTVLSAKHVAVNTAHVATGALLFATAVVLGLRVHRERFGDTPELAPTSLRDNFFAGSTVVTPQSSPGAGR